MTPEAFARYDEARAHRGTLRELGYRTARMQLMFPTVRAFYGRSFYCKHGSHWACNGRKSRQHEVCRCPCHEVDGYRIPARATERTA
jgi:hypothetical protein